MELQNINKQYIKVISSHFNAGDIELVEVEVVYNCCPTIYSDVISNTSRDTWTVGLALGKITQISALNVLSGLPINLINTEYNIQSYSDAAIQTMLNEVRSNLLIAGISAGVTYNSSTHKITVTSVPNRIAMDRITYSTSEVLFYASVSSKGNFFSGGDLYLTEEMFGFDELKDGIYKVILTYYNDQGTDVFTEQNCFFFDNKTQCLLAQYLDKLIKDKSDTDLHMIHYALIKGGNCKCNCDDMCKLFEYLWGKIVNITPTRDCGCNR